MATFTAIRTLKIIDFVRPANLNIDSYITLCARALSYVKPAHPSWGLFLHLNVSQPFPDDMICTPSINRALYDARDRGLTGVWIVRTSSDAIPLPADDDSESEMTFKYWTRATYNDMECYPTTELYDFL